MEWLYKYTRPKAIKTNLMDDENIPDSIQNQGELKNEMESKNESNYEFPDDKSNLGSNKEAKQNTHQTTTPQKKKQSLKKKAENTSKENIDQNLKENMTKLIQKRLGSKDQTSEDEIFGQLIASELSSIPANDKLFIKDQINDVIFKHKRQQQQSNNPYLIRRERIENMRQLNISLSLLTLSRRRPLSYRNQSIDLLCKSMDWFLYDNGLRHERVNFNSITCSLPISRRWVSRKSKSR